MAKMPLAGVISKMDVADFSQQLGNEAAEELCRKHPELFASPVEAEDYQCRNFLHHNGGDGFLRSIEYNFKHTRFFACSAMGHTAGTSAFEPEGVLAPMEWIIGQADKRGLGNIWKEHDFKDPAKSWSDYDALALLPTINLAIDRAEQLDLRPVDRWPQSVGTRVYLLARSIMDIRNE
jgi:hypothetical protein